MCTVVLSLEPDAAVPLLLLAVRDEILRRPWQRPGYHWPDHPGVLGGRDAEAGGTWLALNPAARQVSCVLNGRGVLPAETGRRSRGELPLEAVQGSALPDRLGRFPPFHLATAGLDAAEIHTWDGIKLATKTLDRGTHVMANTGLDPGHPRVRRLAQLLRGVARPDPHPDDSPAVAWATWLNLLALDDIAPDAPQAIIRRRILPGDLLHGSSSISLVAISESSIRYDFITVGEPPLPLTGIISVPGGGSE